ncbi:MAG: hypothetical protein JO256_02175 [Alphaproteobacteria bacterium]|nr:hypothetical protein [Alphaproteobacteria bacterium]
MRKPALKPALALGILIALAESATAGDRYRDRYAALPPPSQGAARYYGPVTNYYGPVTIYAPPRNSGYPISSGYGASNGYATAPACDANCYGAGYDWSHGYGYSYGYGYGYPAYGASYNYGYPPANEGQRLDPWAGYNGGWDNGYW